MEGIGLQLGLVGILIVLNAAFAGSEIALISLRDTQLTNLDRSGRAGQTLARLAREPNRFLATIQIGITLAGFLASAAAAVTLAQPLVGPLDFLGAAARPAAIFIVTVILTFLTLVVGELAPKRIAMQRAERWGLLAARPLDLLGTAAKPVVWILERSTDLVVRVFGGDPDAQREEVSDEELRQLMTTRPGFTAQQRTIVEGAFQIAERMVRDIVVNRTDVVSIPRDAPVEEGVRVLTRSGHSRAPVQDGADLDRLTGVVHLRDLVGASGTVGDHARDALVVPETLGVLDMLRQLRAQRQHMAVVVDEYGSTFGIVTLEDVLEELVGEIYDEFDRDIAAVEHRDDGSIVLPGSYPVHDLSDVGVMVPEGPYSTVAGVVLHQLGRVPAVGEQVELGGWTLTVAGVTDRAITKVVLHPAGENRSPAAVAANGRRHPDH